MSPSLITIPNNFIAQDSHSVTYLNALVKNEKGLYYQRDGLWSTSKPIAQEAKTVEQVVLVGQAINISTLHQLVNQFFHQADIFEFYQHTLGDVFTQQAIVMRLHHNNHTRLLSTSLLSEISKTYFIDCFAVSEVSLNQPGLLVMDMDSTIIDMECIDEIAVLAGVGEKVSELTERAMQGELDFNQSLNARVGCLAGIKLEQLASLKSRLPLNPGFAKTIKVLQQHGWHTVIASGGFTYFADYLKETFELSAAKSNTLGIQNNLLTGSVEGDIVNGEMKRDILLAEAKQRNIEITQTIAIGDGANDLLMMDAASLGVAFKAKPKVKAKADACIEYCGFEGLLYCLDMQQR